MARTMDKTNKQNQLSLPPTYTDHDANLMGEDGGNASNFSFISDKVEVSLFFVEENIFTNRPTKPHHILLQGLVRDMLRGIFHNARDGLSRHLFSMELVLSGVILGKGQSWEDWLVCVDGWYGHLVWTSGNGLCVWLSGLVSRLIWMAGMALWFGHLWMRCFAMFYDDFRYFCKVWRRFAMTLRNFCTKRLATRFLLGEFFETARHRLLVQMDDLVHFSSQLGRNWSRQEPVLGGVSLGKKQFWVVLVLDGVSLGWILAGVSLGWTMVRERCSSQTTTAAPQVGTGEAGAGAVPQMDAARSASPVGLRSGSCVSRLAIGACLQRCVTVLLNPPSYTHSFPSPPPVNHYPPPSHTLYLRTSTSGVTARTLTWPSRRQNVGGILEPHSVSLTKSSIYKTLPSTTRSAGRLLNTSTIMLDVKRLLQRYILTSQNYRDWSRETTTLLTEVIHSIVFKDYCNIKVHIGECIDPGDAYAKYIKYHKECWNKYVVNVLRTKNEPKCGISSIDERATDTEFISSLNNFLHKGRVTTVADIGEVKLKKFVEEKLESVGTVFSKPKRVNEPQRITPRATADIDLVNAEDAFEDIGKEMETLLDAAKILRSAMGMKCKGKQDAESSTNAQRLSQMFVYEMSSTTSRKKCSMLREMPFQVAVGLTVNSVTRSKLLIQFLHSLGSSIEYNKLLRLETQISSEEIRHMEANGGIYIPSDLIKGIFVYCAADNKDFQEDTTYGKGTLQNTVMVVYQEEGETDAREPLILSEPPSRRSLETIPKSLTELSRCCVSLSQKLCAPKIYCKFNVKSKEKELLESKLLEDIVWMILRVTAIQSSDEITTLNYDFHDLNENDTNPAASVTISSNGTGLECALTDLYSDTVTSQILAGKHVRRGVEEHTTLTLALFRCYIHVFQIQHEDMKEEYGREIQNLIAAMKMVLNILLKEGVLHHANAFLNILGALNSMCVEERKTSVTTMNMQLMMIH
ncbi:hypothetical protein PR048_008385 [Dryococelus australis]|uniref:Uncharacterized protein n=1 Tax=Dryococelus australis TaxID=614101 RepID=A0ABQ9HXS5_9NEOP|nr:hypothetical protein PR048_008385 [Dryococelus australis]